MTTALDEKKPIKFIAPGSEEDIRLLIEAARHGVDENSEYAESLYAEILKKTNKPTTPVNRVAHGEACTFFARKSLLQNRLGEACDWFRDALFVDPRAVDYRIDLAMKCLKPMGNLNIARQEAIRATQIEPEYARAWGALGHIEHDMGNADDCIAAYRRQLELAPDDPSAMLDRCAIALDVEDYDTVRELCTKILKTYRSADAWHCLAMIAYRQANHESAIQLYDKAIAFGCEEMGLAHWNKSLALQAIGKYKEGFAENEWRKEYPNPGVRLPLERFAMPLWTGKEPPGRVHVHAEAGAGDMLCQARYLNMIADMGHDVRCEVPDSMVSLFTRSFPKITVVNKSPDYPGTIGLMPFDYHVPFGSLQHIFKTDIDTVPWPGAYLIPDEEKVAFYKTCFAYPEKRKIGLCWSSGIRDSGVWIETYGKKKSMEFADLSPVLRKNDYLVSLQIGPERKQDKYHFGRIGLVDVLPEKPTWDDTAALIDCLDLVITVDTAVAHLSGAMGKPTFLMMQQDGASWHFMCERPGATWNERSPWYPSIRIFRQSSPGDWASVVDRIAKELA